MKTFTLIMNKDITLEDLSFELEDNSNSKNPMLRTLCYRSKKHSFDNSWLEIVFELEDKEVHVYRYDINGIVKRRVRLTMPILQAIYNECKELKWID